MLGFPRCERHEIQVCINHYHDSQERLFAVILILGILDFRVYLIQIAKIVLINIEKAEVLKSNIHPSVFLS